MMGDYHVRFCEGLGGKCPWSTRHNAFAFFCQKSSAGHSPKVRHFSPHMNGACAPFLAKTCVSEVPSRPGALPP